MKGFSAGIPIAILAAFGQVQAQAQIQDVASRQFDPAFEHHIEHGLEGAFDHPFHPHIGPHGGPPRSPHGGPPGGPHGGPQGGPQGGPGSASHPPMAHAARAFRPGEDVPSMESDPFFSSGQEEGRSADHGPSAVPTCSTRTEHIVHTITKTVTSEHEHKHTPTSHAIGLDPAVHASQSSSTSVHAPATTPVVAHVTHSSSAAHSPHTSSAVHIANVPHTSSVAHIMNAPHTSSAHSALIPASTHAQTSTSASHVPVATSTSTVHAPMSYNVIPVHVPSSSHSSIKLHASTTPSSSVYPSGADGTRFHGTYGTPGAGVSFTGAGAQLVPNSGIVTAVCGLLGLLAYAL
jgi:hypothetical protein